MAAARSPTLCLSIHAPTCTYVHGAVLPDALTVRALGSCLTQMGTAKESFVELTERIGRKTGGLAASPLVADVRGEREPAAYLMVSGKAMAGKAGDLFELFRDILLTARLDDRERFKQAQPQGGPRGSVSDGDIYVCYHGKAGALFGLRRDHLRSPG